MEKQTPAFGIAQGFSFKDMKTFKIHCDCDDDSHMVTMYMETKLDEDNPNFTEVSFFVDTTTDRESFFKRLKNAFIYLFKGELKQYHTLLLNEQAAINFANTIIDNINQKNKE